MVNDQTVSIVFFLIQNKSEERNIRAFRQLQEINPGLEPSKNVVVLEKILIHAFQKILNEVTIKGCLFHFAQAYWRKIQDIGLAPVY